MDDSQLKSHGAISATLVEIALENRIITNTDLKKALSDILYEKNKGNELTLVDYLLERNIVDKSTMTRLLAATIRSLDKKFAVLVARSHLVPEVLIVKALDAQKEAFKKGSLKSVGDILIEANLLTEEQRGMLIEKLNGMKSANLLVEESDEKRETPPPGNELLTNEQSEVSAERDLKRRISLVVTNNSLRADVFIPGGLKRKLELDGIKTLVRDQGLQFGVISDQDIENHLAKYDAEPYSFVVALGIHALPARDAIVRIFFINDYLNPGRITEHGTIDFKDRGAVPFVKAGVVLAEKIPGVDGKPGTDVYGNIIPAEQANDQPLKSGPGTELSDNDLKIVATMDGQPLMSVHGEVTVMKELHIQGDVDYTTGNIIFNGSIIVKGSINPGFIIRGGNLMAKDVNGAEIDVVGNIEISGGIINSVLRSGGGVQAMHMSDTKVDAYGDVLVKKSVIGCKIRTSGAFTGESVHVISSLVSAKKGILAKQIGTDVSRACTLRVGISDHTEKKIRYFREEIEEKKKELEKEQKAMDEAQVAQKLLHKKIMEQVQIEDEIIQQKKSIEDRLSESRDSPDIPEKEYKQKKQFEEGLAYCASETMKMKKRLEELFKQQDDLTDQILDMQSQCESYVNEIENLNIKVKEVRVWDKKSPPLTQIKVNREIFSNTTINGPNSMLIVKDTCKNVTIREIRHADADTEWEMKIDPN